MADSVTVILLLPSKNGSASVVYGKNGGFYPNAEFRDGERRSSQLVTYGFSLTRPKRICPHSYLVPLGLQTKFYATSYHPPS